MELDTIWNKPMEGQNEISSIFAYALTIDGYAYAREHFDEECGVLANRHLQKFRDTGVWDGTFELLRCCLFFEQRRWRHFGEQPQGKYFDEICSLYKTIVERWNAVCSSQQYKPK